MMAALDRTVADTDPGASRPRRPTLVVVSGPPGSGKTRLAHALAQGIGCPAVCRDEIKEGMVHAYGGGFTPAAGDPLTMRTFSLFFELLGVLVRAGVTVVAEAAFQDQRWRAGLEPFADVADLRIVHCTVSDEIALQRITRRIAQPSRAAHADRELLAARERGAAPGTFQRIAIAAPSIVVDTTDGYRPELAEILAFIDRR